MCLNWRQAATAPFGNFFRKNVFTRNIFKYSYVHWSYWKHFSLCRKKGRQLEFFFVNNFLGTFFGNMLLCILTIAKKFPEKMYTLNSICRFFWKFQSMSINWIYVFSSIQEYTRSNCISECLTNFTLAECNCVKFSMPSKCHFHS